LSLIFKLSHQKCDEKGEILFHVKYICAVYLLGRDVDDRSPQVDFGIVLNAGQDEENACT
jgi:hypothetical protein